MLMRIGAAEIVIQRAYRQRQLVTTANPMVRYLGFRMREEDGALVVSDG